MPWQGAYTLSVMRASAEKDRSDTRQHRWRRLRKFNAWFDRHPTLGLVRKIVVGTVGIILVVGGMISGPFVPGPQVVVVILGLALLSSEFIWARRAIRKAQLMAHRWSIRLRGRRLKVMWRWKKWFKWRLGLEELAEISALTTTERRTLGCCAKKRETPIIIIIEHASRQQLI